MMASPTYLPVHATVRAFVAFLVLIALCLSALAQGQDDTVSTAMADLRRVAKDMETIRSGLDEPIDEKSKDGLQDQLTNARTTASTTEKALQAYIVLADARAAQLGPVTPGIAEAPDIAAQRKLLAQQRSTIDSAIKRGKLLAIEAAQLEDELADVLAAQRGRTLAEHEPSLASPTFWKSLLAALPADIARLGRLAENGRTTAITGARGDGSWIALIGSAFAILLLGPARLALRAFGRRYAIASVPGHRIRRSGFALWRVIVGTTLPGVAALTFVASVHAAALIDGRWGTILDTLVPGTFVAAFITALAGALLLRRQGSWRLLPISDRWADSLRPWSWALAALALIDPLLTAVNNAARASRAAYMAADTAEALVTLIVIIGILTTISRRRAEDRAAHRDEDDDTAGVGTPVTAAIALVLTAATVGAALALSLGYVSFALWLMRAAILWPAIVAGALYMLLSFADDAATSLFAGASRTGTVIARAIGIRPSAIDQFGVLLSGVLRVALIILGIGAILTPFGTGMTSFFGQLSALGDGITIGQVTLSPGAVLRALFVLAVGLALARGFLRWLNTRYLPTTELDDSARNSVALVARYIGIVVAVLWGLAALGIGLERIALLLSALSVGIGFGLQAITQNFVSGLILLAERPVKIGDLVRIGNDEGDVKRISVRSTEIELADHSTLIVPNSKLITETVLNKTLANPMGRIQIQFTIPLGTDPVPVRAIVMDAFRDHAAVLDSPAPAVHIDNIANGQIAFNCFAHVGGPREVYSARSGVLMQVLQRFAAEGIEIGSPPTRLELIQTDDWPHSEVKPRHAPPAVGVEFPRGSDR